MELGNIYYNIMKYFRYLYVAKLFIAKIKENLASFKWQPMKKHAFCS